MPSAARHPRAERSEAPPCRAKRGTHAERSEAPPCRANAPLAARQESNAKRGTPRPSEARHLDLLLVEIPSERNSGISAWTASSGQCWLGHHTGRQQVRLSPHGKSQTRGAKQNSGGGEKQPSQTRGAKQHSGGGVLPLPRRSLLKLLRGLLRSPLCLITRLLPHRLPHRLRQRRR